MPKHILIVDDDREMRLLLSTILQSAGYQTKEAENAKEGLKKLSQTNFDLIITDLHMPQKSGMEFLQEGKTLHPETVWLVLTGHGSIQSAVKAIRAGASDYLTKPLSEPDILLHTVARIFQQSESEQTISLLSEELGKHFPPTEKIFLGTAMMEIYQQIKEVALTPTTVLILGPSGVGKELVARTIHRLSPRHEKPFITIHCAALSESLLESELFGHEKGAFTGATAMRKGRFELANNGTIFLDEIAEIPPSVQVKLLRVLQEKEFERVGGERTISVDLRIVAATNKNLKEEIKLGRFREDLYYRLHVFPILVPPLSERREIILPLAEYFAQKFSLAFGKKKTLSFQKEAQQSLLTYSWPGNIRELQNVMERAVILATEEIKQTHLNLDATVPGAKSPKGLLQANERDMIERVLKEVDGNRKLAAERLGISLRTLHYRIKDYGIS